MGKKCSRTMKKSVTGYSQNIPVLKQTRVTEKALTGKQNFKSLCNNLESNTKKRLVDQEFQTASDKFFAAGHIRSFRNTEQKSNEYYLL